MAAPARTNHIEVLARNGEHSVNGIPHLSSNDPYFSKAKFCFQSLFVLSAVQTLFIGSRHVIGVPQNTDEVGDGILGFRGQHLGSELR
jgi:hypothetical protein